MTPRHACTCPVLWRMGSLHDGLAVHWGCGGYLPFGPAKDTPAVLVEIRAAEIAGAGPTRCLDTESMEWNCEQCGWESYNAMDVIEYAPPWLAGWLARQIATHGDGS
jgi:hypothetical protein